MCGLAREKKCVDAVRLHSCEMKAWLPHRAAFALLGWQDAVINRTMLEAIGHLECSYKPKLETLDLPRFY